MSKNINNGLQIDRPEINKNIIHNIKWIMTAMESDLSLKDLSLVCRGCLASSGEMKNMIEWGYAEDFSRITNIQINNFDNLSELLCTKCEEIILGFRNFVQQCMQSDLLLKDAMQNTPNSNDNTESEENLITSELNENKLIIKITAPNTETKIYLPCHQCHVGFIKKSDLFSHLLKKHQVADNFIIQLQFYCSVPECVYTLNSKRDKYFSGRKYLNQHIFKVHRAKHVSCNNCDLIFNSDQEYNRHLKTCNFIYICKVCDNQYKTNEKLLVHLLRKHPELHKQYKTERKAEKRKLKIVDESKKFKTEYEKFTDSICDSPKKSFATQTSDLEKHIKNDVTLPSWQAEKSDETKKDEISTQTVFEDMLSPKSQTSDDDLVFSETVSLSDIQTQTTPLEFGLSRINKETITSETHLSIKETQTCLCLYGNHKLNRCFESISPSSNNNFCMLTSAETQTLDQRSLESQSLLSFTSTETQTCFDDLDKDL